MTFNTPIMIYKYIFILLLLTMFGQISFSQTIERQVIGFAGSTTNSESFIISSTSGETVINTGNSETIVLNNGFQQPLEKDIVRTINIGTIDIDIAVYPNPTTSVIKMNLFSDERIDLEFEVYGSNGKIILKSRKMNFYGETIQRFDLSKFPSGTYYLIIKDKKGVTQKTYKIQKI